MTPLTARLSARSAAERDESTRTRDDFIVFGAPVLGEAELAGVEDCLNRRWIGTGPKVQEFEQAFAAHKRADHAVAVNSGSAALHLALEALGVGPGDEVVTTTMTFCATVSAVVHAGATPVLADCDPGTFNVTAEGIAGKLTPRTKAVIVVHMCGRCCEMDPIIELARNRNVRLIEDCAHAIESSYHGTPSGLMGDVGCFSFYATKNLTTGEGGMVLTRDADIAREIQTLANHGLSHNAWRRFGDAGYKHYTVIRAGYKYNMPDINAALGVAQLAELEARSERREAVWRRYDEALSDLPCTLPPIPEPNTRHARHLYTVLLDVERLAITRDEMLDAMTHQGIGVGVHYIPVHQHPYYRDRLPDAAYPNADFIGARTMSLPLTGGMTDEQVEYVCAAMRRTLLKNLRRR